MVVVEDGLPKKSDYRKFAVTGAAARDDTAAMHDVLTRRFRHYLQDKTAQAERPRPDTGAPGRAWTRRPPRRSRTPPTPAPRTKFAYPPNLVVVDGGKPQVNAAARALAELGIDDVYVVGLAKRLEEVWLPDSDFPVILPRASPGLYLLQRIRDEAHRFAITFHRQKRGKAMTVSALDGVPGLGDPSARPCWRISAPSRASRRPRSEELTGGQGHRPLPRRRDRPALQRGGGGKPPRSRPST